ncbi:MAG: hypothetical protein ACI8ZF_000772, partial [Candidatus Midichloriaceae bacterium]
GICKNCKRALCSKCYKLVENIICCNSIDHCKTELLEELAMIDRSKKMCGIGRYKNTRFSITQLFVPIMGLLFFGYAIFNFFANQYFDFISFAMGLLFILFGILYFFKKDKLNC